MKNIFASVIKKFKDNVFFKTYALILLPVFIIILFLMISTYSYNNNYMQLLMNSYLTKLESICSENETSLQNIATMIKILSDNDNFMSIVTSGESALRNTHDVSDILTQVKQNNQLIDSICVYNRGENTVYSDFGTSNATNYFTYEYHYAEYSKNYWDYYDFPLAERKILAPSLVISDNTQKIIIPIVFTKIGDVSTDNLVIVNVNLSEIIRNANNSKLTDNSTFLVVNRQNRNIFNENNDFRSTLGDNFFDEIFSGNSSVFDCRVDGENSIIMSYTPPSSSILGYTYTAILPYSDINNGMAHITLIVVTVGFVVLLIVLGTAYLSTKHIYSPIENLASMFENTSSGKGADKTANTLQRLHVSIQETLESNYSLSNEMSKALPLIQERYLINLLNSNEHYIPDKDNPDTPVDFKYDYFCSIVIKLKPTEQFYNMYNNMEYNAIKTGIHNIIQTSFSEKYDSYIIPSETDTLYVLLNLPDNSGIESIIGILEEFQHAMEFDKDYMTLKIGIGGIYSGLEGLKKSHHEAVNSVSAFIGLTHVKVQSDEDDIKAQSYTFSMNDENNLLNHLIIGRTEDAKELIDNILHDNIEKNISDTAIIQLYIQMLNIIFKVMRMKNISYDPENSGDFNIITGIINRPVPDIYETVLKYIDNIKNHMGTSNTKVDIQAVIAYMEEHFSEDIGLPDIADHFNTSSKYLSKLIKDKLGVNFLDYIAGLRISEAKIQLAETGKSISDIYAEVGFNNRNTFIRTFKKITGLTPSEFRKSKQNK